MEKIKNEENCNVDDKYRMYSSLSFVIVVIMIGVPMWWKTTEVYRVNLPYADIQTLSNELPRVKLNVAIYTFEAVRGQDLAKELQELYKDDELWDIKFNIIEPIAQAENARTPAVLEALIIKQITIAPGDLLFVEWPKAADEILFTTDRTAFFKSNTSAAKIKLALNMLVLQSYKVQQIVHQNEEHAIKAKVPQTEYIVLISVLNPRPDIMAAKWNVKLASEVYIEPFLREVSHVSKFTLKSQWRYQLDIGANLKQIRDDSQIGRHYAISETALPHVITSVEKNLGVGISDKSVINLVAYVPPCDIAPLHIYTRNNDLATRHNVDSFISPNWGAITIANPPNETCLSYNTNLRPVSFYVNTNDVMQIMLYQLLKLLDITSDVTLPGVSAVELTQLAPRRWEYESYIRRSALSHITTASNTLQSLIKLLDKISYIVINDDVGRDINEAFAKIQLAKSCLREGDVLNASIHAKSAFVASEKAFFDSTLLAQLYFPDEQKYAIYIPLFLPILVPVITSFSMLRKFFGQLLATRKEKLA